MHKSIKENPEQGQLCFCRCPNWNDSGFQITRYASKKGFYYEDQLNPLFNDYVEHWYPLNEDGTPGDI